MSNDQIKHDLWNLSNNLRATGELLSHIYHCFFAQTGDYTNTNAADVNLQITGILVNIESLMEAANAVQYISRSITRDILIASVDLKNKMLQYRRDLGSCLDASKDNIGIRPRNVYNRIIPFAIDSAKRYCKILHDLRIMVEAESLMQTEEEQPAETEQGKKLAKKQRILEIIHEANELFSQIRKCSPSSDPDHQTAATACLNDYLIHIKRMVMPFLPEYYGKLLSRMEVEINDVLGAYEVCAELDAILPDIEFIIQGLEESAFDPTKVGLDRVKSVAEKLPAEKPAGKGRGNKIVKKSTPWKPPKGYIGSKTIVADYNIPRTTLQGWAERDEAKVKKDKQTGENYYQKKWLDKRCKNYKPRPKA